MSSLLPINNNIVRAYQQKEIEQSYINNLYEDELISATEAQGEPDGNDPLDPSNATSEMPISGSGTAATVPDASPAAPASAQRSSVASRARQLRNIDFLI